MKHKVLIMRCDTYDADRIGGIIREGMEELGVRPTGRILLKPNVVLAHPEVFPYAFTRSEFLDGAVAATKACADGPEEIAVGERSGITVATRFTFKMAGYRAVIKKHGIKAYYFDECHQVPFTLTGNANLRRRMYFPKPIVDCDFLINLPKFKAHPWCRLTLSLKNFIGIQDDRHRLVDHNLMLEHKIADLQEVIQPRFIAIDAITAGQGMMLTPTPFAMGAIVMGTNSCAVDTVGCHMVHVDPKDLIHLRLASERGFGPMDLAEIDVGGDFPLAEMQQRTRGFEFCLERIDEYFPPDCGLKCTVGAFPEEHSRDYCWGGCPGALQEAMHIFKAYYPTAYSDIGKLHYVCGQVDGPIDFSDDERIIFVGSCTSWEGDIDGEHVKIDSTYKRAHEVDESKAPSNDMLKKNLAPALDMFRNRKKRYLHVTGCPVSVGEHVHYVSGLGGLGNPNYDPRMMVGANLGYWRMRLGRLGNRLLG